ncbi:MAG: T9SS type A sorting domain-containing protein, partial [Bacteroidales bacterium]|nr:T9SS type A sorting domain-containing protein [Bacteroidales bacterium]
GGAIFLYEYSNPIISGCLFYGNKSDGYAGAVGFYEYSTGVLLNNTIANNSAEYGGALAFMFFSSPEIINTILWNNIAANLGNQVYLEHGNCIPGFYYCDVEDGTAGFGGAPFTGDYFFNLEEDPGFTTNPDEPVYSLSTGSPCIDMGTPDTSAWYLPQYLPAYCLCGNPRICGPAIDMGCYERLIGGINDNTNRKDFSVRVFPNPVNSKPIIEFYLKSKGHVNISIMDIHGKVVSEIQTGELQSGKNKLTWNAENVSPGIYFCRLHAGGNVEIAKIVVMK